LQRRIDAYEEHARFLARQDPARIPAFLADFRGLARVRIADADGRVTRQFERFDDLVAEMPAARRPARVRDEPPAVSGLESDRSREDLRPDLRRVFRHTVARPGGGALELTVYAGPLVPRTLVTADGEPMLDSEARFRDGEWRVVLPPSPALRETAPYIALGIGVLTLGLFAFVLLERQRVERKLAQDQRLKSLGLLASGIAHEINNPLEGIANWLALGETERAKAGLDRIAKLTGDLLRFARGEQAEAGTPSARLKESFENAHTLAEVSRVFKDVAVDGGFPGDLAVRVPAAVLEQVFLNLLLNAGAASARTVRVASDADAHQVRVTLTDDGPGIPEEDLPRVFDPFFTRTGGTGLGLSVSYGMIEAAGGRMRAGNAAGGGARFILELPRA
jgi:signal transduction histidine kinase